MYIRHHHSGPQVRDGLLPLEHGVQLGVEQVHNMKEHAVIMNCFGYLNLMIKTNFLIETSN